MPLNIFAFSDPHANRDAMQRVLEQAENADIVVGAGDFADRGEGTEVTLRILESLTCPIVLVSGNHDRLGALRDATDAHANMHLLHGTCVNLAGLEFLGIGSAIASAEPSANSEWLHEEDARQLLDEHPAASVLVSHTPPAGIADIHPDGTSGGSRAIRHTIERLQPRLCLCGHVHHAHGVQQRLGSTLVHNLGPSGHMHRIDITGRGQEST